jgi:hypothetical protein
LVHIAWEALRIPYMRNQEEILKKGQALMISDSNLKRIIKPTQIKVNIPSYD